MNGPSPTPFVERPTNVRYGVLGFACALSMVTYLDRVCFGAAADTIRQALGLQDVGQLKWAFTAFTISYALFEIPSGWLGDVYGPRRTLIRIVLWWSTFTVLTALVPKRGISLEYEGLVLFINGLGLLVLIRFLFGIGEAGAYPNITRALHNWFPFKERGLAQGTVWMSGRLMGGLTPLIWMVIVNKIGLDWRTAFFIFGGIGLLWCIAFSLWFRNRPDQHPGVNQAELELINQFRKPESPVEAAGMAVAAPAEAVQTQLPATRPVASEAPLPSFSLEKSGHTHVPWLRLVTDLNLWALCLMYFCASFGWYFNITYLPSFLETQFGVEADSTLGSIYKGGPLLMGATTCLLGGFLSDRFVRRSGNVRWGRRTLGIVGHSLCGICYFACLFTPTAFTFFLAISLAAFWNDLTMGSAWAACQDIGKRYAAIVAGCMNTIGNLGGAAAGYITGTILERYVHAYKVAHEVSGDLDKVSLKSAMLPGYQLSFVLFAGVYVIAVLLWLRIDASRPVAGQEP
jgi:MFS transporter, ACS family, glucarate transporter